MDLTTSTSSPTTAAPEPITGSCLCGGIQYEVTGEPMKRVMCHCENCRKFTGSSFMANSFMKESQLTIKSGESLIQSFKDTKVDSGNTLERRFCRVCGSPVYVTSSRAEGFVVVPSGTMDGEAGRKWRPEVEFWCKERREYLPVVEGTQALEMD
ncbi:GFA family protein [Aspergillus luchuensis]|uniref:CENP-V/GFA domain-containing protein n=1 Tax=Aspergillus kawachii TaxID=1069201 RepID=A0A146G116_ASPKA|nr:uncharacterized protein AKAW2_60357S [Aspergillus luchuensis]BCS02093.1 hypothetical protein AKAW2_60357S [Aspergillus luchuensis]BCS13780.1 hypothetical protein ALUC_60336S [Aspergillus luchuensis]GAA90324.1 hypothetical protein AKAW_08438 [Aspergillus luchuensis IFO 4308]GAT30819.1 hypothetical protein RIB2604_03700260 [Aspergillus luchuensis]